MISTTLTTCPNAIFTFFIMSTTAGWSEVMTSSITSTEIDYVAGG
jgi:hypothetical protein